MSDVKNLSEFHECIRAAVESLRDNTGVFVSTVMVQFEDAKVKEINTTMGTRTKYDHKTGYKQKEEDVD